MKKMVSLLIVALLAMNSLAIFSFATDGQTLDDIIEAQNNEQVNPHGGNNQQSVQNPPVTNNNTNNETTNGTTNNGTTTNDSSDLDLEDLHGSADLSGLADAGNLLEPDIKGVSKVQQGARKVAAFIIQVVSYCIIVFLAVSIMIDLVYITLPMTRTFLANGYVGQAQASGQGMPNGSMGGMGSGYSRGGYGGYSRGGYGGYNRGYGGIGGMGGMNGGIGGHGMANMDNQNAMNNRNNSMMGNIQWVSDHALHAVATASQGRREADGKTPSPYKIYFKEMAVKLTLTPILIVLASTGVVTKFGFMLADVICGLMEKLTSSL